MARQISGQVVSLGLTDKRHVKETGWGLYANTDISARDTIVCIRRPLVISLDIPRLKDTCYSCLGYKITLDQRLDEIISQDNSRLQICTGCHVVRYCSKHCQTESWKTIHKHECDLFARLRPNILPNNVRAIIQILRLRKVSKLEPGVWDDFMKLEAHLHEWKSTGGRTWENIGLMARGAKEYSDTDLTEETMQEIFCKLLVNCFTMVSPCYDPLGLALHPLAALVNHSCDYNAVICFEYPSSSHTLSIRALRPIARNEQIVVSYIESTNPRHMRQKELQERYYFTCECNKCSKVSIKEEESSNPLECTERLVVEQRAFELLAAAQKDTSISGPIQKLQYGIHILRKPYSWPLHQQPLAALRQHLIVSLMAADQFQLAFVHAWIQYRSIDHKLMPEKHHPIRLVHQWLVLALLDRIECATTCTKDLPIQKYNILHRVISFEKILQYVLHSLYKRTKNMQDGNSFAIMVRVMYYSYNSFERSDYRPFTKAELLVEAEKLQICTTEVLEQELVWGKSQA